MQVPCRYPDQCQGYAGTLQVSSPVSEVCRYPVGILTSVMGIQRFRVVTVVRSLTEVFDSVFPQGVLIKDLFFITQAPVCAPLRK